MSTLHTFFTLPIQEPSGMDRRWADMLQDDILLEWALEQPQQPPLPQCQVTPHPHRSDLAFDSHYCETNLRTMEGRDDFPDSAPTLCGGITNKYVPSGTYGPDHPGRLSDYLFRMIARAEHHGVSLALGLRLANSQGPQGPQAWEVLRNHLRTGAFVAIGNISLDFTDRCHAPVREQLSFA